MGNLSTNSTQRQIWRKYVQIFVFLSMLYVLKKVNLLNALLNFVIYTRVISDANLKNSILDFVLRLKVLSLRMIGNTQNFY